MNGRRVKAVMQAHQAGFTIRFDRATGDPVWPIEERPGPAVYGAGRDDLADAAVPDQAATIRTASASPRTT